MEKHTTSSLMLIRPARFFYNAQTAVNNAFQDADSNQQEVAKKAAQEFENLLHTLQANGVNAFAVDDTPEPETPDSIFPNNWISTHSDGRIVLFPMFAENRRLERKASVLSFLNNHFAITGTIDFTGFENAGMFLEGTGSMVFDRINKIAYACLSPRTSLDLLNKFCDALGYAAVWFDAVDEKGQAIYHTNVMMAVGTEYAVVCLDAVKDGLQKETLVSKLQQTNKTIVPISFQQMNSFAGNMLQVESKKGEKLLVMSTQAHEALDENQIEQLAQFNKLIHSDIGTIEKNGGGSVRCMLAEIHLPAK